MNGYHFVWQHAMVDNDVASNFSKKQRHIVKRAKVSGDAREMNVLFKKKPQ